MELEKFLELSKEEQVAYLVEKKPESFNSWEWDLSYSLINRNQTFVSHNQKLSIAYENLLPYFYNV